MKCNTLRLAPQCHNSIGMCSIRFLAKWYLKSCKSDHSCTAPDVTMFSDASVFLIEIHSRTSYTASDYCFPVDWNCSARCRAWDVSYLLSAHFHAFAASTTWQHNACDFPARIIMCTYVATWSCVCSEQALQGRMIVMSSWKSPFWWYQSQCINLRETAVVVLTKV